MFADRYDLALSTASAAARDDYVQGCDRALTFYPGAIEAFDRAILADPSFSLAHAAKAQVLMREGNVAAARAALAAAKDLANCLSERELSHINYFDLAFAGQTDVAIDALYAHLAAWPRDALVLATAANPNGLIGTAAGRNRECRMGRRFCGVLNSPAIRATLPLGAHCTTMRAARCRRRAAGSPTCMSSWRRP